MNAFRSNHLGAVTNWQEIRGITEDLAERMSQAYVQAPVTAAANSAIPGRELTVRLRFCARKTVLNRRDSSVGSASCGAPPQPMTRPIPRSSQCPPWDLYGSRPLHHWRVHSAASSRPLCLLRGTLHTWRRSSRRHPWGPPRGPRTRVRPVGTTGRDDRERLESRRGRLRESRLVQMSGGSPRIYAGEGALSAPGKSLAAPRDAAWQSSRIDFL